ncbi:hypothetical protein DC347_00060 [Pseudarthrobacter sp. AG30]|uniref:PaaX family transcriptional regulator C-terminal domain-containing protein n=1 Tax=Pseudarthrobacter sp. efr-133-R2A-89 TaxID=3040302 RepID=UPI000D654C53|nr:hypothetical protein DC347_00060 [Pseudarthrobacter sp. AG30]
MHRYLRPGPLDPHQLSGEEAFWLRTGVIDAWRAFPWEDPGLPPELLTREFSGSGRRTPPPMPPEPPPVPPPGSPGRAAPREALPCG